MLKRIPRVTESKSDERCEKHQSALAKLANVEQQEECTSSKEEIDASKEEEKEEELPFQDVLADKRREYNPTQQFVQLVYNDLVTNFVKSWEGTFLRKSAPKRDEANDRDQNDDDVEATIEPEEKSFRPENLCPDENAKIEFVNGNSYTGRVSKRKMEGQGIYRWRQGSRYEGAFEDNKIQGKGVLEWQDCVRYEGDFEDGYYHGKGSMVDRNYNLLYIGEWRKGHKHGKGLCRYGKNGSYDGYWAMDKREGAGDRWYPNGARYVGDWRNNLRHGMGTMTWPNGDSYRGEWDRGEMHGNGEYTWDRHSNESFCWPREICYAGQWHRGARDGRGQLTLNSIGGARYFGGWKKNDKHGYGMIIGDNGDVTEGDPLFENNICLPVATKNVSEVDKNIPEARVTSVLRPEQRPSLSHYVDRLRQPEVSSSLEISSTSFGKCRKCEDVDCRCLGEVDERQKFRSQNPSSTLLAKESASNETSGRVSAASELDRRGDDLPDAEKLEEEERWVYQCIAMHMPQIRRVYDTYSKIFCKNESQKLGMTMTRLCLWQLWRDCGIHRTNLSLVQIDRYLAANKCTLMEDPHGPYERIEIWQLIHALLEVSWHLYAKTEDHDDNIFPGRLANGLHKLLVNDIYPNAGTSTGILCGSERDLLPLQSVHRLYKSIGEPHTVRQLLMVVYSTPADSMLVLRKLDVAEFIRIACLTCPRIKDPETGVIVNMEYELTLLEFLEIFANAGKNLVRKRREREEALRGKTETISMTSTARRTVSSDSAIRSSAGSKSTKPRKKLTKKR